MIEVTGTDVRITNAARADATQLRTFMQFKGNYIIGWPQKPIKAVPRMQRPAGFVAFVLVDQCYLWNSKTYPNGLTGRLVTGAWVGAEGDRGLAFLDKMLGSGSKRGTPLNVRVDAQRNEEDGALMFTTISKNEGDVDDDAPTTGMSDALCRADCTTH